MLPEMRLHPAGSGHNGRTYERAVLRDMHLDASDRSKTSFRWFVPLAIQTSSELSLAASTCHERKWWYLPDLSGEAMTYIQSEKQNRHARAGSTPAPPPRNQTFFVPGPLPGANDIIRKHHMVYSKLKSQWGLTIARYIIVEIGRAHV